MLSDDGLEQEKTRIIDVFKTRRILDVRFWLLICICFQLLNNITEKSLSEEHARMRVVYIIYNFILVIMWFYARFRNIKVVYILIVLYEIRILIPLADFEKKIDTVPNNDRIINIVLLVGASLLNINVMNFIFNRCFITIVGLSMLLMSYMGLIYGIYHGEELSKLSKPISILTFSLVLVNVFFLVQKRIYDEIEEEIRDRVSN